MKLNIACGTNVFPKPWLNIDHTDLEHDYLRHIRDLQPSDVAAWPEDQRKHVEWLSTGQLAFYQADLRRGFPIAENGTIEAIYLGQVVEHLHPHTELPALLKECHRMLKPGGAVRITTPCLKTIMAAYRDGVMGMFAREQPEFYAKASQEMQVSYLLFGASGAGCTRENYEGHFHIWTSGDMRQLLLECGFSSTSDALSPSLVFAECTDKGMSHSFAVEAVK